MKRISIALLATCLLLVIGSAGANQAAAGQVDMRITVVLFGFVPIDACDATFSTTGGPPPANVTIDGSSLTGQIGSGNPCDPTQFTVDNDPVVSFAGANPWLASINTFAITENWWTAGCAITANFITMQSTTGVAGLYAGDRVGTVGPGCGLAPSQWKLRNVIFY